MRKIFFEFRKNKMKSCKGFMLVELIVGVSILSLLLMSSVAVLGSLFKSNNYLGGQQQDIEEMSIALSFISKSIRMSNCGDDGDECSFSNSKIIMVGTGVGAERSFEFVSNQLVGSSGGTYLRNVTGRFYVPDDCPSNGLIPRVTITVSKIGNPNIKVQTTVSLRSGYNSE